MEKGFSYLEKNISDTIVEGMVKLGDTDSSRISIYYTSDLAAYLLGTKEEKVEKAMSDFKEYVFPRLGDIEITKLLDGRFGITVSSHGIAYMYNTNSRREFLKKLITAMNCKDVNMNVILEVFHEENDEVICENVDDSEFQYIVFFKDEDIDEFKYCFTFDQMGKYYHRLIDYDFYKLVHHKCGL